MEVFGLNISGENLKELKNLAQNPLKNLRENRPKTPLYIGLEKTSRWGHFSALAADGRPARSTANGQISDRWSLDRPANRPCPGYREQALCPVDRPGPFQRAELSGRSTGSVDRPSSQTGVHVLCTSVDRPGRPTPGSVDRSGRPTEARQDLFRDLKVIFLA